MFLKPWFPYIDTASISYICAVFQFSMHSRPLFREKRQYYLTEVARNLKPWYDLGKTRETQSYWFTNSDLPN